MSVSHARSEARNSILELELLSTWELISEEGFYGHEGIFVFTVFLLSSSREMYHSRKMEHRIKSIHKRALKLVFEDSHDLTFQE